MKRGMEMKKNKNLSENKIELLSERVNDTNKLAEEIPKDINVSEIEKDQNGKPIFKSYG